MKFQLLIILLLFAVVNYAIAQDIFDEGRVEKNTLKNKLRESLRIECEDVDMDYGGTILVDKDRCEREINRQVDVIEKSDVVDSELIQYYEALIIFAKINRISIS